MLPKQYRKRYALIFLISLLLHLAIFVYLFLNPIAVTPDKPETTTVEIQLKPEPEPKETIEEKKPEPKKPEPKKAEPKKVEPKKAEPKKAEPKKAEPKKAEPKKAEPKKAEPKKAEPKKAQPKKAEPKKAEPKKAEPKKAEPKKAEPKKAEPKKAEPKKAEPKKAEPKKAEPKKAQASEGAKTQGGASKGQQEESKDAKQTAAQTGKKRADVEKRKQGAASAAPDLKRWTEKLGGLKELTESEYADTIVYSMGEDGLFSSRQASGRGLVASLNPLIKMQFNQGMNVAFNHLSQYISKGNFSYEGPPFRAEVQFIIDLDGNVTHINLKTPSPIPAFDRYMMNAVRKASPIPMPKNPDARKAMAATTKLFYYDQTDL